MSSEMRPKRHLDPLTPSQRKNKELADAVPRTATLNTARVTLHNNRCENCVDFPECSLPNVRNAKPNQNYCAWSTRVFRRKL